MAPKRQFNHRRGDPARRLKTLASWVNTKDNTLRVSLTASGRVLERRSGSRPIEVSHFSERWLDKPDEMVSIIANTLGPDWAQEKGR